MEGITDGARYADLAEAHKATKHQVMRCTNCGFETTGGSMAHTNWLEKIGQDEAPVLFGVKDDPTGLGKS